MGIGGVDDECPIHFSMGSIKKREKRDGKGSCERGIKR